MKRELTTIAEIPKAIKDQHDREFFGAKEPQEFIIQERCNVCFIVDDVVYNGDSWPCRDPDLNKDYICKYCKEHPSMTDEQLLDRMFSIMNQMCMSDIPNIMRKLWEYLKTKKEDNNG